MIFQTKNISICLLLLVQIAAFSQSTPVAPRSTPSPHKADKKLEALLHPLLDTFPGVAGIYVRNLHTDKEAAINADTLFPTASIIKLPILIGIFDKINQGLYKYEEPLIYHDSLAKKGSGLMQFFKDSTPTDLRTVISLMITHSDNSAAVWCEKLAGGGLTINTWLDAHGFTNTRLNNRTPGREQDRQLYGWGQTTPREMARLVTMIRNGEAVSPTASQTMYRIMTHVFYDDYALSGIPPYTQAASKQGMVDDSRSEVVLVNAPHGDYVFYIATKNLKDKRWIADNPAWTLARKVSALLWNYYEPHSDWKPTPAAGQ